MIQKETKANLIETYKINERDTGSPEVQIAILTERINTLTEHLKKTVEAAGEDPYNRVLHCIPTNDGEFMYHDQQDRYWRAYRYIHNAFAYDRVEKPERRTANAGTNH